MKCKDFSELHLAKRVYFRDGSTLKVARTKKYDYNIVFDLMDDNCSGISSDWCFRNNGTYQGECESYVKEYDIIAFDCEADSNAVGDYDVASDKVSDIDESLDVELAEKLHDNEEIIQKKWYLHNDLLDGHPYKPHTDFQKSINDAVLHGVGFFIDEPLSEERSEYIEKISSEALEKVSEKPELTEEEFSKIRAALADLHELSWETYLRVLDKIRELK